MGRRKKRKKRPDSKTQYPPKPIDQQDQGALQEYKPAKPESARRIDVLKAEGWMGPLPSPQALKEFNEVIPGAANRIIIQFEKQAEHRQHLERTVVESRSENMKRGQCFGFIIGMFGLAASAFLIWNGHELAGSFLGGIDLVGLVSVFIYGTHTQREERKQRKENA